MLSDSDADVESKEEFRRTAGWFMIFVSYMSGTVYQGRGRGWGWRKEKCDRLWSFFFFF